MYNKFNKKQQIKKEECYEKNTKKTCILGLTSITSAMVIFILTCIAYILFAFSDNANGIGVSIVVPIIVFNIYLISVFVFFLKINFKFYSIYAVLHLLLTTAMWFLLFFYLSHWFISLFNVSETGDIGGIIVLFTIIPILAELVLATIAFIVIKIVVKSKNVKTG
ncbi:MAG: hypothetical protein IJA82_02920 [Clostridia bacterium]|nr:hypothetical protein [Clostridia bacterium]